MRFKKIAGLILAGAMALGACSCDGFTVKPDGPRETTDETTAEEVTTTTETEATSEATTEETTEATAGTETSANTSAGTSASGTTKAATPELEEENEEGTVFVSFQGKNFVEITENILKITNATRSVTLENFPDKFTIYPNDTIFKDDSFNICTYFWDPVALNGSEGIRDILVVLDRNPDGSLGEGSRVDISIIAEDKDRMQLIYNAGCEALKTACGRTSLMTSGEGDLESSFYLTYFVSKKPTGDNAYSVLISLPLRDVV
jgi:hypothetical protein